MALRRSPHSLLWLWMSFIICFTSSSPVLHLMLRPSQTACISPDWFSSLPHLCRNWPLLWPSLSYFSFSFFAPVFKLIPNISRCPSTTFSGTLPWPLSPQTQLRASLVCSHSNWHKTHWDNAGIISLYVHLPRGHLENREYILFTLASSAPATMMLTKQILSENNRCVIERTPNYICIKDSAKDYEAGGQEGCL